MSAFDNFMGAIGGIGNAAGIQGDGPGGANALQRAALPPEQSIAYNQLSALAKLAQSPEFQKLAPADKTQAIAAISGSSKDLQTAAQQGALAKLATGNVQVDSLLPFMQPEQAIGALTNPMLMSGPGGTQPAPVTGTPAPATAPANASGAQPDQKPGLNYNYLNSAVPAFYRNQVLDVVQGGELAKDVSPRDRTLIMNWAHNVDPSFTETIGTQRNKMAGDIASNSPATQGGQATQINSVMGHLYDLHEAAPGLGTEGHMPATNWFANQLVHGTGLGLPKILGAQGNDALPNLSKYEAILERASPELNKFYVGGEGDTTGRAAAKEAFSQDLPTSVIQNNVKTQMGLLSSKTGALQGTRDKIMGSATSPVLNNTAQALMADINGEPLTDSQKLLVNLHRKESNLPPKTWDKQTQETPQKQEAKKAPAIDPMAAHNALLAKGYVRNKNGEYVKQ